MKRQPPSLRGASTGHLGSSRKINWRRRAQTSGRSTSERGQLVLGVGKEENKDQETLGSNQQNTEDRKIPGNSKVYSLERWTDNNPINKDEEKEWDGVFSAPSRQHHFIGI